MDDKWLAGITALELKFAEGKDKFLADRTKFHERQFGKATDAHTAKFSDEYEKSLETLKYLQGKRDGLKTVTPQ